MDRVSFKRLAFSNEAGPCFLFLPLLFPTQALLLFSRLFVVVDLQLFTPGLRIGTFPNSTLTTGHRTPCRDEFLARSLSALFYKFFGVPQVTLAV